MNFIGKAYSKPPKELIFGDKTFTNPKQILDILESQNFYWLIDSTTSDAVVEIKKNTIIWHDGNFLSGNWHYGIFKKGEFYGVWENGIWEGGQFNGNWISGIKK